MFIVADLVSLKEKPYNKTVIDFNFGRHKDCLPLNTIQYNTTDFIDIDSSGHSQMALEHFKTCFTEIHG